MIRNILIIASICAASTTAPAIASDTQDRVQTIVRTSDLDMSNASDRARLDRRVTSAARTLCASGMRGLAAAKEVQQCVASITTYSR